jgi:anti-sigma B factor antagonist
MDPGESPTAPRRKHSMDLAFERHTQQGWTILSVAGELDLHTSPQLAEALATAMDAGTPWVAVNMQQVSFMDSSSLGVIVASSERAREHGGGVAVACLQPAPMKVIALTGLDTVLTVVERVEDLPER